MGIDGQHTKSALVTRFAFEAKQIRLLATALVTVSLAVIAAPPQAAAHDFLVDQTHHHTPNFVWTACCVTGPNSTGQEFTPAFPWLDVVEIYVGGASAAYLNIREQTITGPLVGTSAPGVIAPSPPPGEPWFGAHFDFPSLIPLVPETLYVIEIVPLSPEQMISVTGDGGFQWNEEDRYHRGRFISLGVPQETNDLTFRIGASHPPGDFNLDDTVDAADYVQWRKTNGTANGYNAWRTNFGATGPGSAAISTSVPEPTAVLPPLLITVAALLMRQRFVVRNRSAGPQY